MRKTEKNREDKKRKESSRTMLTRRISSPYLQICEGHLEEAGLLFIALMIRKKIVVFFRVSEVGSDERRSKVRLPPYIMKFDWQ